MSEKSKEALRTVKNYMWWSMGAGLIPVPVLDLVAVSGVQLKMLSEVSKVYSVEFQESRGKAILAALIGYVVPSTFSFGSIGSLLKGIPIVGPLVGAPSMVLFCGASTYALGRVFIQHYESGQTFLTFDPEKVKEYFQKEFEEGQKLATDLQAKNENPVEVKG